MKIRLTIALLAVCAVLPLAARQLRTGPSRLIPETEIEEESSAAVFDTIACPAGAIVCSGYDKPNRATKETLFVTNLTPDSIDVCGLILTFDYSDMNGRQLHQAHHCVRVNLPAGETRAIAVPSWDKNNSFHYFRSTAPQRKASTPYKVSAKVDSLLILAE